MRKKGKAKVLTKQEFKRVDGISLLSKYGKRNRAMLYLAFGLGLRACEIRNLLLTDILNADGTIKETVKLTKTKGDHPREVYLTNKKLVEVLIDHIEDMKKYLIRKRIPFSLNLPVFRSHKGHFFFTQNIIMIFDKMFKSAGIEGASSHSGRRTFITHKIDEGFDIKSIADLVGHKYISQTIQYHHSNPTRLKKIVEKSIF